MEPSVGPVGCGERKIKLIGEERELSENARYWEFEESEMGERKQEER